MLVKEGVSSAENTVSQSGIYDRTGEWMAGIIISVLAFLIALLIAAIIVGLIGKATDVVNHIPLIGGVNRFLLYQLSYFRNFCGQRWIRTTEVERQQIYSLPDRH